MTAKIRLICSNRLIYTKEIGMNSDSGPSISAASVSLHARHFYSSSVKRPNVVIIPRSPEGGL
jgi:hypothetical protein